MATEILAALRVLAAGYPLTKLSDENIEVYARKLEKIGVARVRAAVDEALNECEFFPTIAKLLDIDGKLRNRNPHTSRAPLGAPSQQAYEVYVPWDRRTKALVESVADAWSDPELRGRS